MKKMTRKNSHQTVMGQRKTLKSTSLFKQKGASAIEYAVIAAVIVVAIFMATSFGIADAVLDIFEKITDTLEGAGV